MFKKPLCHLVMAFFIVLATACSPGQIAIVSSTASVTPTVVPGCEAKGIDPQTFPGPPFQSVETISSNPDTRELNTILEVKYGFNQIADCPVKLRSYDGRLVGPTLRAKPGDTLKILVKNMLPPNPPMDPQNMDTPHDFNTTNLHTHGLHVSPNGDSDNVLRTMEPSREPYPVEIHIPADHPAGTFWYHPHVHGSTAVQVSSGMEGALIIEGGLDDVPEIKAAQEKILVFQQIAYDTQGEIENFNTSLGFANGKSQWVNLQRQHTINGQLFPVLTMQPGEVQRWRMIHAGVEETIMATLYGPGCNSLADLESYKQTPPALKNILAKNTLNEIAVDGLALGKLDPWKQIELEPGYRSDVLVKLDQPGNYCLVDESTAADHSVSGAPEAEKWLATVKVMGDPVSPPMPLPDASELAPLKPFKDIQDSEITGHQSVVFCMCKKDKNSDALVFTINGKPFDENHSLILKLNAVEQWNVSIDTKQQAVQPHPFHIHVNPFQSTRTGPDGNDEIVWRDTLLITQDHSQRLLMRYKDYTGTFVMHCHILGHEDQGMMELVEIR